MAYKGWEDGFDKGNALRPPHILVFPPASTDDYHRTHLRAPPGLSLEQRQGQSKKIKSGKLGYPKKSTRRRWITHTRSAWQIWLLVEKSYGNYM